MCEAAHILPPDGDENNGAFNRAMENTLFSLGRLQGSLNPLSLRPQQQLLTCGQSPPTVAVSSSFSVVACLLYHTLTGHFWYTYTI